MYYQKNICLYDVRGEEESILLLNFSVLPYIQIQEPQYEIEITYVDRDTVS